MSCENKGVIFVKEISSILNTFNCLPLTQIEEVKIKEFGNVFYEMVEEYNLQLKKNIDLFEFFNTHILESSFRNQVNLSFYYFFAIFFSDKNDKLTSCNFVTIAEGYADKLDLGYAVYDSLATVALNSGFTGYALDLLFKGKINSSFFDFNDKNKLKLEYKNIRSASKNKQLHGHYLLLNYLKYLTAETVADKVLIEIGTTREQLPGQGSTQNFMEKCRSLNMHFITVDMDPNNTIAARKMFDSNGLDFKAITSKGEDYLKNYVGLIDYVFLDAYDFDHEGHSALRQERYIKYLGSEIEDEQCHQMHLECAEYLFEKLAPDGIICLDDTWQNEKGQWMAKGTLAIPFLLKNNFKVIESSNNAVLLKRCE